MSDCPSFLTSTSDASGQPKCEYRKVLFTRISLCSYDSEFYKRDMLLVGGLLPCFENYKYSLRILRAGFLYLMNNEGELHRTRIEKSGPGFGEEWIAIRADLKEVWATFSEHPWLPETETEARQNPDLYMQKVTLVPGQPGVAEGRDAPLLVEEFSMMPGMLNSIRGFDESAEDRQGATVTDCHTKAPARWLNVEPAYANHAYMPFFEADEAKSAELEENCWNRRKSTFDLDPDMFYRWWDSAEKFLWMPYPHDTEAWVKKINEDVAKDGTEPEAPLLVAMHDPMGISKDFAALYDAGLETANAIKNWFTYPESQSIYADIGLKLAGLDPAKRHKYERHLKTSEWKTVKHMPVDASNPPTLPPDTEDLRYRVITRKTWDMEQHYLVMQKPGRTMGGDVAPLSERDVINKRLHSIERAVDSAMRRFVTDWEAWLSASQPFGFVRPFLYYYMGSRDERELIAREQALADCLNNIGATSYGFAAAVRVFELCGDPTESSHEVMGKAESVPAQKATVYNTNDPEPQNARSILFWQVLEGMGGAFAANAHTFSLLCSFFNVINDLNDSQPSVFSKFIDTFARRTAMDFTLRDPKNEDELLEILGTCMDFSIADEYRLDPVTYAVNVDMGKRNSLESGFSSYGSYAGTLRKMAKTGKKYTGGEVLDTMDAMSGRAGTRILAAIYDKIRIGGMKAVGGAPDGAAKKYVEKRNAASGSIDKLSELKTVKAANKVMDMLGKILLPIEIGVLAHKMFLTGDSENDPTVSDCLAMAKLGLEALEIAVTGSAAWVNYCRFSPSKAKLLGVTFGWKLTGSKFKFSVLTSAIDIYKVYDLYKKNNTAAAATKGVTVFLGILLTLTGANALIGIAVAAGGDFVSDSLKLSEPEKWLDGSMLGAGYTGIYKDKNFPVMSYEKHRQEQRSLPEDKQVRSPDIGNGTRDESHGQLVEMLKKFSTPWVKGYTVRRPDQYVWREGLYVLYYPGQVMAGRSRAEIRIDSNKTIPLGFILVPWRPRFNPYIGAVCWECMVDLKAFEGKRELLIQCQTEYATDIMFNKVQTLVNISGDFDCGEKRPTATHLFNYHLRDDRAAKAYMLSGRFDQLMKMEQEERARDEAYLERRNVS